MQPEQGLFLLNEVFLPTAQKEHRLTKTIIQAIPTDKWDYRPEPFAKSAMELAWHIVATEMRFLDVVPAGGFDFSPRPRPESITGSKEMADWYGENFASRVEKLQAASPEQLVQIVDFRGMVQSPAVMYLNLMNSHSIHHRGQLSTYLRPMGSKVPSIYGESYDAAEARKAAAAVV